MRRRAPVLAGLTLTAALAAAACGSDEGLPATVGEAPTTTAEGEGTTTTVAETTETTEPEEGPGGPTATEAAELRAGLTALLQEHVYSSGQTLGSAISTGVDSPATAAASATLDDNSVEIGDAISTAFGDPEVGEEFLRLWRDHIGYFVDYTVASSTGDAAGVETAQTELDAYREDTGALLEEASGEVIAASDVSSDLEVHVDELLAVIDALLADSTEAFGLLRTAAQHMPETAAVLAAGIVEVQEG